MPTYEYRCDKCGEHHEVVQSFRDDPLTECPACGGPLKKVFGSIGVVFKGSGFYKTDSRSAAKGASKDGDRSTPKEAAKAPSESSTSSTSADSGSSSTTPTKDSGGSSKSKSKDSGGSSTPKAAAS